MTKCPSLAHVSTEKVLGVVACVLCAGAYTFCAGAENCLLEGFLPRLKPHAHTRKHQHKHQHTDHHDHDHNPDVLGSIPPGAVVVALAVAAALLLLL